MSAKNTSSQFYRLEQDLQSDDRVIGLWLGGSRAKGYHDENSDYDLLIIAKGNKDVVELEKVLRKKKLDPDIGLSIKSLGELREYSHWGRHDFWVRYSFEGTKALFDRTGEVQKIIDRIGTFPKDKQQGLIRGSLDAYQNSFYRSLKAGFRKQQFALIIEANQSIGHLLTAVFALHLRFTPYPSYLEPEIKNLTLLGGLRNTFMKSLSEIVSSGNADSQIALWKEMRKIFCENGFPEGFDIWEDTFDGFFSKYGITLPS